MTRGLLSSMAAVLASAGMALAQAPAPMPPGPATGAPAAAAPSGVVAAAPTATTPYGANGAGLPAYPDTITAGGPGQLMTTCGGCGGACGVGGCGFEGCPAGDCNHPCYRWWFNGEYLLWRFSSGLVPALAYNQPLGTVTIPQQITDGTPAGTFIINQEIPVLLQSNVAAPSINLKDLPGFRVGGGFWCDPEQCLGFDFNFWWLTKKSFNFNNVPIASPSGTPNAVLIPTGFSNQYGVPGGTGEAQIITVPINLLVNINAQTVGTYSTQLWGMEYNARTRKCYFGCTTFDCLAGFRYMNVEEELSSVENLTLNGVRVATVPDMTAPINTPVSFAGTIVDSIRTDNDFYGAQVGVTTDICLGCGVFLTGAGKVALGDMHERIRLVGFTQAATVGGGSVTLPGGTLVGPADNGTTRTFDRICCIPEVSFNLGYQPCHWLRGYVGYNCMYISTLARPGNLTTFTNTSANVTIGQTTQSSNVVAPTFVINDVDAFLQGINFGLEVRW